MRKWGSILFIGLVALILLNEISLEQWKDTVLIHPIEVPKLLSDRGKTSEVIAKELKDKINNLVYQAGTHITHRVIGTKSNRDSPDIEVSGLSGIGFGYFIGAIKRSLFDVVHVTGDISRLKQQWELTLRISMQKVPVFSEKSYNREDLLSEGARYILKYTNPVIFAAHVYTHEHSVWTAIETLRYCVNRLQSKDHPWAYNLWGYILTEQGKTREAIEKFKQSIRLNSNFPFPYLNWGWALIRESQNSDPENAKKLQIKAEAKLMKAQEIDPTNPYVSYAFGFNAQLQNNPKRAISHYEKAVEMDPEFIDALILWGALLGVYRQDHKGALEKFENVIQIDKKHILAHINAAFSSNELGNNKRAIKLLEKARELDVKNEHSEEIERLLKNFKT